MRRILLLLVLGLLLSTTACGRRAAPAVHPTAARSTKSANAEVDARPWLEQLGHPQRRRRALEQLELLWGDALKAANGRWMSSGVRSLARQMARPLTDLYVRHFAELDAITRVRLILLLFRLRDERTQPAMVKALEQFARRPSGHPADEDILWACRSVAQLRLSSAAEPLLAAFERFRVHTPLGQVTYRALTEAMLAVCHKSWRPRLQRMLEPRITAAGSEADGKAWDAFRDHLY